MIRKVSFSNFYSFNKLQTIDFVAQKKRSYSYANSQVGDQITKVAAFIGGNASGKTNVMRLFSFLSYFVCMSSKDEAITENSIAFKTFFNNKLPSKFHVEYEDKGRIFFYSLTIKNNIVVDESLSYREIKKHSRDKSIFIRNKNKLIEMNPEFFKQFPHEFMKNIRLDVSLIAFLKSHYNIEIINDVFGYFFRFRPNINEVGEILHNLPNDQVRVLEMYLADKNLKAKVDDLIASFDLGLSGFDIKKDINNFITVKGTHLTESTNKELGFIYESTGSRALFFILGSIIKAIENNSVLIIDEFEFGLHPEAVSKLLSYIIDENAENKAQVIFSSHSFEFMNKLDMHQIYLTDKNKDGESDVCRLNKVEGLRSDENFLTKYMSGAYGGFPAIRI